LNVPIWILGSSLWCAIGRSTGLPYALPRTLRPSNVAGYQAVPGQLRRRPICSKPHVMLASTSFAADSDEEAAFRAHATSV
jgi:hypothetical protein